MSGCRACGRSDLHLHRGEVASVYDREAEELSSRRRHPSGGLREETTMLNAVQAERWVLEHMEDEVAAALARFTKLNQHWQGAQWPDVLEVLNDTDSNLEVIEPLYEREDIRALGPLPAAIALTLAWSSIDFYAATADRQYEMVMEWIGKDAP